MPRLARLTVVSTLLLLTGTLATLRAKEPAALPESSNLLAEFPIHTDGDLLLLPVSVYGGTYDFMFDTGCTDTIIDARLTPRISPSADSERNARLGRTLNGEDLGSVEYVTIRRISLGTLPPFCDKSAARFELSQIREACGHDLHGVLGMDLFRDAIVRIDADTGRLQFLKSRPKSAAPPIPIYWSEMGMPRIRLSLRDKGFDYAVIDSGFASANALALDANLYRRFEREGLLETQGVSRSMSFAGPSEFKFGVLQALTITNGPSLRNVLVGDIKGGKNVLGLAFLLQFNVVLDFPENVLMLEPRQTTVNVSQVMQAMSGLDVRRRGQRTFVESVSEDSPAAMAGVQAEDTIQLVAGKPASDYRLHTLRSLFESAGPALELELTPRRGPTRRVMLPRKGSEER